MNHTQHPYAGLRSRLLAMTALAGLSAALAWPASDAHAAGFAIKEQSGSAQGNSFAGATAGAEDISYMFFNPAGLTRHEGNQVVVAGSYILPGNETDDATLTAAVPWPNGEASENGGDDAFVPAFYAMWSASPDLKVGLGVNAPFGLRTEYSQTWAGRYHAVESEMKTININPVVAYRVTPSLSLAIGVQAEYMEATLSNMVPVDVPTVGLVDTLFEITGDHWGWSYTLGAMYEMSPQTRFGFGYRSETDHDVYGTASLGSNTQTGGTSVTMPRSANFGVYHELSDSFALMAELEWIGWSSLDQLIVRLEQQDWFNSGGTLIQNYNWEDTWFAGIGASWQATEQLKLRTGIAYDQSPIPNATRTPRVPGSDRTWLSIGASFDVNPGFTIDAAYTHIFMDDATVSIADQTAGGGLPGLDATFENKVDIFVLQAVAKF